MDIQSRLDSVTVYSQGAIVRRVATALAPAEGIPRVVRIPGLPLALKPTSLRASVMAGPADLRVMDVRSGIASRATEAVDVPAEQGALEVAEETLSRLEVELGVVDRDLTDLKGLRARWPTPRKSDPPRPSRPETTLALMEFVATELRKNLSRRAELAKRIEDSRNDVELHRRRLAEAGHKRKGELQLSRMAIVTLSAAAIPGELTLGLEYLVPGARWSPSYELRLDKGLTRGTLLVRAAVAQASGEDWAGVELSLSTADLDRRSDLPELKSLRIGRVQPAPPRPGWREPPPGLEELFEGYTALRLREPRPPMPPKVAPPIASPPARAARPSAPLGEVRFGGAEPMMDLGAAMADEEASLLLEDALGSEAAAAPAPTLSAPRAKPAARHSPPAAAMSRAPVAFRAAAMPRASVPPAAPMSAEIDDDEEAAPPPPAGIGVDPSLLDYDALVMGRPEDKSRGRLRRASEDELMLVTAVQVRVDVLTVLGHIRNCERSAQGVSSLALPQGAIPLRQSAGSFDHRYDCVDRVDVAATGTWHVVPVLSTEASVAVEYTAVPSVEPNVYRVLRLENRSPHALLGGPVGIVVDDDYVMTSPLPPLMAGHHTVLGLGVAEAVKIARNTSYKETTAGLLGGQSLLQHEIEVEISNGLGVAATVNVRERVPVPDEETIKVEETLVQPEWQKDEGAHDGVITQGGRAWKVTLPAGEKLKLAAHYSIRIPSDKMLVGGNRRVR